MRLSGTVCFLLFVIGGAVVHGADTVVVQTLDGRELTGAMSAWRLGEPLSILLPDGKESRIEARDVDRVVLVEKSKSRNVETGAWRVDMQGGMRLFVEIVGGDDQHLAVRHFALGDLRIPVERLVCIQSAASIGSDLPTVHDEDVVIGSGGEAQRGTVARFAASGVSLAAGSRTRTLAWPTVAVVMLASVTKPEPLGAGAMIQLSDGSRLRVTKCAWEGKSVVAESPALGRLSMGVDNVDEIEVAGGRRTWLSEVAPKHFESIAYLNKSWPLRNDENVMGGPLVIAGRTYRRGLGAHSACKATWDLDGRYKRFRAAVGIDDSAGGMADADMTVSLDGRVVAEMKGLVKGQALRTIDVDLSGAAELTIEVGFGKNGHVQDRVDIVNASLIGP